MKKQFAIMLLISVMLNAEQPHIQLQSKVLSLIDGNFMNADRIEGIRGLLNVIRGILWGFPDESGQRVGRYEFDGQLFSAQKLIIFERELEKQRSSLEQAEYALLKQQLDMCLTQMKNDFVKSSNQLKKDSEGALANDFMFKLIHESCEKRNRMKSALLAWASADVAKKDTIFDTHVKTIRAFNQFCIDLSDFLGDLMHSCPKAVQKWEARNQKLTRVHELLREIAPDMQQPEKFLSYVKYHHLDKLSLKDITTSTLRSLLIEFGQHNR